MMTSFGRVRGNPIISVIVVLILAYMVVGCSHIPEKSVVLRTYVPTPEQLARSQAICKAHQGDISFEQPYKHYVTRFLFNKKDIKVVLCFNLKYYELEEGTRLWHKFLALKE